MWRLRTTIDESERFPCFPFPLPQSILVLIPVLVLAVAYSVSADALPTRTPKRPVSYLKTDESKYQYDYAINDQEHKLYTAKNEVRKGSFVMGAYSVVLPDGRTQTVTYKVTGPDSGFEANVEYSDPRPTKSYKRL